MEKANIDRVKANKIEHVTLRQKTRPTNELAAEK